MSVNDYSNNSNLIKNNNSTIPNYFSNIIILNANKPGPSTEISHTKYSNNDKFIKDKEKPISNIYKNIEEKVIKKESNYKNNILNKVHKKTTNGLKVFDHNNSVNERKNNRSRSNSIVFKKN